MATKRLTKNVWHKVVAPAANTVYIQPPRVTGLLLQYGATTPPADDVTGLFYDRLITLNAGLTAWVKPSASGNVFVTDTAGGDPMPDTDAPAPPVTVTAKTGATAAVGATIQPGAMFTFGNSAATDYTYTTTTPAATATLVAGTGVVTGVAAGTGNVTATHKTKPSVTATATYTITAAP